jgi:hypothetical protein
MSDLRTRIAAINRKHLLVRYDRAAWWCQCGADCLSVEGSHAEHVADAVIRELKLEVEDGECGYCHAMLPGCRYSTWKADE